MPNTELTKAWRAFAKAAEKAAARRITDHFAHEPQRLDHLCLEAAGLRLDLSKQPWDEAALRAALALARSAGVEAARDQLFAGDMVNPSEARAALHVALRAPDGSQFRALGEPVSAAVEASRTALRDFAQGVRKGRINAASGRPFRHVLHIGIGGSDLGPRLLWQALKPLACDIDVTFVANVDGADIAAATAGLDPRQTLVVVVSKTFTTAETMANARAARAWLADTVGEAAVPCHLAAVSTNLEATGAFGVPEDRVFGFWDWVGGRYSVWSAVGLSCAIGLGWPVFERFLAGGAAMDAHFRDAPLEANAPVLLALSHILNRNGLDRPVRAVVPYAQRLALFPAHLQQLEMESNGKSVGIDGKRVEGRTSGVAFGDAGTNGQHAFFQLLHQGTDVIPVDFIAVREAGEGPEGHQAMLLANCLAQAEALLVGKDEGEVRDELRAQGLPAAAIDVLAPQKTFSGDRPSNLILLDRLSPETFGALVALYEHKTFVEGAIWGVNSFDQWGVELGKTLASRILAELNGGPAGEHDPSTAALIGALKA